MVIEILKEKYTELLKRYVDDHEAFQRSIAEELGRDFAQSSISPEELKNIHENAVHTVTHEYSNNGAIKRETDFAVPFLEILMSYSSALQRTEKGNPRTANDLSKLAFAFNQSSNIITITDKDGAIEYVNPKFCQVTGYSAEESIGKNPRFLKAGDMPKETYQQLWKTITSGGEWKGEFHNKKKNGESYWEYASISPVKNDEGIITHFLAIKEDITARKHAERRLKAQHSVTRILSEADTLAEAMPKILESICEALGWDFGEIWEYNTFVNALSCTALWHVPTRQFNEFLESTKNILFTPGIGLPGRIWETKKSAWIPDVTKDTNFPRALIAAKEGLHGAFGFPVLNAGKRLGVIDFFSHKIQPPDDDLLNMMDAIGKQIGQFMMRKNAEEQYSKLSQAINQSPSSIVITDNNGDIEYVNPSFTKNTGYSLEEVIRKNPRILKSGEVPSESYKELWETINSGKEWRGDFHNKRKDGTFFWEHVSISPIKNNKGTITHFVAIKEDITERKNFESRLLYLANNDPLTNLFNRRRFREELNTMLAQSLRYGIKGALLFLDLDNFKYVNDTLGHQKGDELLKKFAVLLRQRMRETDILARFGGDEFAILLPHTNAEKAMEIARHIIELVREKMLMDDETHPVGISIGIVLFPEHGTDADKLLVSADLAMYMAKEDGKNCARIFTPEHKIKVETRLTWERRIRDAIKTNQFVLHLQPIMSIKNNNIGSYEALLRMQNEDGELVLPDNFIHVAERFGLISDIDKWVICKAIQLIAEYEFDKKGLFLEVNISGKALSNLELLNIIKNEITKLSIDPGCLVLEITETAAVESIVDAQNFIKMLKGIGCRFAIDDFGSGFSSLSNLKHLEVDYMKIDGSFIRDLPNNPVDQHLVKAMVEIARWLGKKTIAEYVGCNDTIQLLKKIGVDFAQGYHIGKPMEIDKKFFINEFGSK
ncbi:MAG: EAL domain-containing protein [Planctomycetes bacterium]|nr:EAL domain-containing protein [Planctomycetota bacterium]